MVSLLLHLALLRRGSVLPFASLRSRLLIVAAAAITPFVLYAALTAAREKTIADAVVRD
jgi:hypothetical protein